MDTAAEALKSAISNTDQDKIIRKLDDADTAVDEILKNVKGFKEISTVFSKDQVNLSTGNFIYDRTALEIQDSMPVTFDRFSNFVNDWEVAPPTSIAF